MDLEGGAAAPAEKAPVARSAASLLALIGFWYASSCVAITTSKMSMNYARVPFVLCATQFGSATALTRFALAASRTAPALKRAEFSAVAAVAAAYAGGFALTNVAFSMASAPFVETVKAAEPVSTAALAAAWLGEREPSRAYAALVAIVVGVALATATGARTASGDAFYSAATAVVLACNVGFSLRAVLTRALKRDHAAAAAAHSPVVLFHHVSRLGLPGAVALAALRDRTALLAALAPGGDRAGLAAALAVNGCAYAAYNLASFAVLGRVSATTHAVLNVFRRVAVIAATTVVFGVRVRASNVGGIALAVAGISAYAAAKRAGPGAAPGSPRRSPQGAREAHLEK